MEKRIAYLDYLRIISILAVIVIHVCADAWETMEVSTDQWGIVNFYNSMVRWAVPLFVMISGALFLNYEHSIKKIFGKNILRIVVAYLVWSFIYAVGSQYSNGIGSIIRATILGHYHLQFLKMLVGLYILTPCLYYLAQNEVLLKYFIILNGIVAVLVPSICNILDDLPFVNRGELIEILRQTVDGLGLKFVAGDTGYFFLGYYLSKADFSPIKQKILYVMGILGFIMTFGFTQYASINHQRPTTTYFNRFSLGIYLTCIGIFVFFKYHLKSSKQNKTIQKLAYSVFGVYLVHVLVMEMLEKILHISVFSFTPLISVPIVTMLIFTISTVISIILNKIPVINRYIV